MPSRSRAQIIKLPPPPSPQFIDRPKTGHLRVSRDVTSKKFKKKLESARFKEILIDISFFLLFLFLELLKNLHQVLINKSSS